MIFIILFSMLATQPTYSFHKKVLFKSYDHKIITPTGNKHTITLDSLLYPENLDKILNPVFVNKMAQFYVAGAAISIVKGYQTIYTKGFGRAEVFQNQTIFPEKTIFRIGSVTKVVTVVAIMQLVDKGLIDLENDVNQYLKELKIDNTFPEPVRVKHLLTHTAGFDQLGINRHVQSRDQVLPLGEFLKENLIRIRPPGEVSCYDTYAITLAGYLVEQITGQSYEEYIIENIFNPLEMDRSNIVVPKSLEQDVAMGYEFRGVWYPQEWEFMNTDPASTVNSTVTDMANFMKMFLNDGVFKGKRILSKKSVYNMMQQQYTNHPLLPGYGYGFWENSDYGISAFSHGGSMTGFGSMFYLIPEHKIGVYICYNQEASNLSEVVLSTFVGHVFPEILEKNQLRKPRLKSKLNLERYMGTYANNMYNHSKPELRGWRKRPFELKADENGQLLFGQKPYYPVEQLVFQRNDGLILVFRENENGEITHLFVKQTVYEKL